MHLYILIIATALFPQAYGLQCYQCPSAAEPCSNTTQCPSQMNQCGSSRVTAFIGNSKNSDVKIKSCVVTEHCVQGSVNFGLTRKVYSSKCCNSNLCNTGNAPEPPKAKPNGKKCYRCDGRGNCEGTLNCDGNEDHCISASVKDGNREELKKGCSTKSMCLIDANILGLGKRSCCQGDFCNGSSGTSASLVLLPTMLLWFFFLSN